MRYMSGVYYLHCGNQKVRKNLMMPSLLRLLKNKSIQSRPTKMRQMLKEITFVKNVRKSSAFTEK
jgi:hypothetical protein